MSKTVTMMPLNELRVALEKMQERAPGQPCVSIDLSKVFTFTNQDGSPAGVIPVQEVIYLADLVLREARQRQTMAKGD